MTTFEIARMIGIELPGMAGATTLMIPAPIGLVVFAGLSLVGTALVTAGG